MKKFRFRLERVLHYRQLVREEKRRLLALANSKKREATDYLERLEKFQLANESPNSGVVDINMFLMVGMYGARLKEAIVRQRLAIMEAEKEVEEALAVYVEAAKDARALELLKDKKRKEYVEYVHKEDEKNLDELVTQRVKIT